jgi:hypothetical protein
MRILVLIMALTAFTVPAMADCGTHSASNPNTVATSTPPAPEPPAAPSSGG